LAKKIANVITRW